MKSKEKIIRFMERLLPDFIYDISLFEGNPMTLPEVMTLLDGVTVGGHRVSDEQMILNLKSTYKYLFKESIKDNKDYENILLTLHTLSSINLLDRPSRFRVNKIKITGTTKYNCPNYSDLENIFERDFKSIIYEEDKELMSLKMFCWLVYNQFFEDCNKRTARLFTNYLLLNNCNSYLQIHRTSISEFRELLIKMFDEKETKGMLNFLLDKCVIRFDECGELTPRADLQVMHRLYGEEEINREYFRVFKEYKILKEEDYKKLLEYLESENSLNRTSLFS